MSIIRKVRRVERLFLQLERETQTFKSSSGLHCLAGCGQCCTKADIEASVLEFLPLALHWFLQGISFEKREQYRDSTPPTCHLFMPGEHNRYQSGKCGAYEYRGMICRLFGYSVTRDKSGQPVLATCKLIKENQPEEIKRIQESLTEGLKVPTYLNYYQSLTQVDFKLGQEFLPINKAIVRALDEVHGYYAYRPFPRRLKRVA